MKILGISCSMRKEGNSEILLNEALTAAAVSGAETELVLLNDKTLKPCEGCYSCTAKGECRLKDDMQQIYPKMSAADGIIFSTPVYFFHAAGQTKILLDRCHALYISNRLANKVGGVIALANSMGHSAVFESFSAFFSMNHMLVADFVYGFGRGKGEVRRDRHGMQAARELGKQMVLLARQGFKFPEPYKLNIYRYVKELGIENSPMRGRFEPGS